MAAGPESYTTGEALALIRPLLLPDAMGAERITRYVIVCCDDVGEVVSTASNIILKKHQLAALGRAVTAISLFGTGL